MYSDIVLDHFMHPRCVGALEDANARGQSGTPGQGPYIVYTLRVDGGRVAACRFTTYGCPAVIASGSLLAEWATGRPVGEAGAMTADELQGMLGGLPLGKEHCPRLAVAALRDALGRVAPPLGERR